MVRLLTLVFFLFSFQGFSQVKVNKIKGVVSDMGYPLANVNISVKGTTKGIQTDADGRYEIEARPRDVLVFGHLGMKTIEVVVEDVTSTLNLDMIADVEELDEVEVKKRRSKNQHEIPKEYGFNKDLIKTSMGIINKRAYAGPLQIFDESDFNPGAVNFIDAIRSKFIGGIRIDSLGEPLIFLRPTSNGLRKNPKGALYDIDGLLTRETPINIPIVDIERIAILKGPSATARYGPRALGGVIIINTKAGMKKELKGAVEYQNLEQLRADLVDEDFYKTTPGFTVPGYLEALYGNATEELANMTYDGMKGQFGNDPYFFIDTGNHFLQKWKNIEKAQEIWNHIKSDFSYNPVVLKALAYTYDENGMFDQALQVYQKVASLRPKYAQSYRDLANIYIETGNTDRALNLYGDYMLKSNSITKTKELEGIDFIVNMESLNIVSLTKKTKTKKRTELETIIGNSAVRILIEWNNSEAEFDIPFINRQKEYFVWKHTYANNVKLIEDEKTRGYSSVQFIIDKYASEEWNFNLKYYGNKSYDPTYLKTTIYYNYGRPSQKREIKVFRLAKEDKNLQLFTINHELTPLD